MFSCFFLYCSRDHRDLHSFPTRRSSDLHWSVDGWRTVHDTPTRDTTLGVHVADLQTLDLRIGDRVDLTFHWRSEEHTSELQSQSNLVCRLLLEKKKTT